MASAGLLSLAITGCVVLYFFDPSRVAYPLCLFKFLTGLDCPGCGTLRALHQLLHGDLPAALNYNVLTITALPLAFWLLGAAIFTLLRDRGLELNLRSTIASWLAAGVIITFWILRNVPLYPFTILHS